MQCQHVLHLNGIRVLRQIVKDPGLSKTPVLHTFVGPLYRLPNHAPREASVKELRTRTKGHERTRRDHATELTQDYVEAIDELHERLGECRVRDLAKRFAVSHVTVNRAVARMKRDGYVDTEPYAPVTLTEKGRSLAQFSKRRHEIVYQFLLALGVSQRTASIDSEGIEHHVSDETLRLMERFGSPAQPDITT
jgi:DtxR family manganese transport transcriptional regulator